MKFLVTFSIKGIKELDPGYRETSSKIFEDDSNITTVWETSGGGCGCLYIRDLGSYKLESYSKETSVAVTEYDDFVPGRKPDELPEWHRFLKDRIISIEAVEHYGPGQNIRVSEGLTNGSALAIIRHQRLNWGRDLPLAYTVKISARGTNSLVDSIKLHKMILSGEAYT